MSETTTAQIELLSAEFKKLTASTGALGKATNDKARAEATLTRDLGRTAQKASGNLENLATSSKDASGALKSFLGFGLLGGTISKMISIGEDWTDTYRTLSASGHTFNGSMLNMSIAAANAGMPLKDFADNVLKNSLIIKAMGKKDYPKLQKDMRTAMVGASNFGMTMEGITDFQAKSWETTRKTGLLKSMSDKQLIGQTMELATVTSAMSDATGVAREEILNLAQSAIQGSLSASRIAMMNSAGGIEANKKLQQSITILAAQSGEAGKFLSALGANTFGMDGMAEFTDEGKTLINAGMGELASSFSMLSENMSPEATVDAMNNFRIGIKNNLPNLRDLAKSTGAGSEEAKRLIHIYGEMKEVTVAEMRQKRKDTDGMTKFMLTISTLWDQIAGGFRSGFLKGFKPLFKSVKDFENSKTFMLLKKSFEKLGEGLGFFVNHLLSEPVLKKIGNGIEWLAGALLGAGETVARWGENISGWKDKLGEIDFGALLVSFGTILGGVALLFKILSPALALSVGLMEKFPDAAKLMIAAFAGKALWNKLTGMFRSSMNITAGIVNVMGGMGGRGRRRRRGSRRGARAGAMDRLRRKRGQPPGSRFQRGMRGLGRGVGRAGRMGMGLGRGALTIAKKIPGLGLLTGLGLGAAAIMSGQGVARAGLEVASGLVSMVPGIGTAASIAIDAGLMAKDASDSMKDTTSEAKDSIAEGQDKIAEERLAKEDQAGKSKKPTDPMMEKFDIMIAQLQQSNDLMMASARSQKRMSDDQVKLLSAISKRNV